MFVPHPKGIIALDIDGTICHDSDDLASEIQDCLVGLKQKGWGFIFITGRPFQWAIKSLHTLPFTYAVAAQNGAILVEMPISHVLTTHYLTKDLLGQMDRISRFNKTDFVVYSGPSQPKFLDTCYYRSLRFPDATLSYILKRAAYLGEKWINYDSFDELPFSDFASIKFFVPPYEAMALSQKIEVEFHLHAPPIEDPINENFCVIQVTHPKATKGEILKYFLHYLSFKVPVIAAGDDMNDQSMLEKADVKIVMSNAPNTLLQMADIIAPVDTPQGIVQALLQATTQI